MQRRFDKLQFKERVISLFTIDRFWLPMMCGLQSTMVERVRLAVPAIVQDVLGMHTETGARKSPEEAVRQSPREASLGETLPGNL